MGKQENEGLDFVVDKLTNSIENTFTGDSFRTEVIVMKKRKIELDVDFVGGQTPLTKEEEKMIHDFFQSKKMPASAERSSKKRISNIQKERI